jgi:hypothetical protein
MIKFFKEEDICDFGYPFFKFDSCNPNRFLIS